MDGIRLHVMRRLHPTEPVLVTGRIHAAMATIFLLELWWISPVFLEGKGGASIRFNIVFFLGQAALCWHIYRRAHIGTSKAFLKSLDDLILSYSLGVLALQLVLTPFWDVISFTATALVSAQYMLWLYASSVAWCSYSTVEAYDAARDARLRDA